MDFDGASFHDPMNIIDIDLIRNDIIDRTNKQFNEIQLINFPNEMHISAWATYGPRGRYFLGYNCTMYNWVPPMPMLLIAFAGVMSDRC